jgi:glycosyltransferase involved in cell wall biosynthesis
MMCKGDDLATCCGKCEQENMKVVAVIPVLGRRELVRYTIERLYKKNKVEKVICVGHHAKDERICKASGAEWVFHENKPLAAKWNSGFIAAKKYNPMACLFVGSSDWVSDNWIATLQYYLKDFDMVGLPGCYLLDINHNLLKNEQRLRACYWPGYVGPREGESIGIGRLISARVLEKMNWMPFENHLDNSLDYSMQKRVLQAGGKLKLVHTNQCKSMAISTNMWVNKHQFEAHWNNRLPSKRLDVNELTTIFPEAKQIFQ